MKCAAKILAGMLCLLGHSASGDTSVMPVLIGIYAQSYDDTVSWYSANFGFKITTEVVNDAANLKIGFLDNGAFELEIYSDIAPASETVRLKRDRFGMPGEGFVKLSVETVNLHELADTLRANGVAFVREINESDRKPGKSWFMVKDPDGNLVQVFGPTPITP
jgi:catechol 2,3-dioxygenase-like lactoylglutathione lyase family enzyme